FFNEYTNASKIFFSGSGSKKLRQLKKIPENYFLETEISSEMLTHFSWKKYICANFENVAYAQPLYIKEFYTTSKKMPF
ncbi:MAG: hypothetical protein M3Z92_04690, partial [Bacteroidota bacterium]|nr:hypothetical protein [Bacteroidota bacterium]